jgi:hypothetical protein
LRCLRCGAASTRFLTRAQIVSVGDQFYDQGVSSVEDPQWQSSFTNIYTNKHTFKPWHIIQGTLTACLRLHLCSCLWATA